MQIFTLFCKYFFPKICKKLQICRNFQESVSNSKTPSLFAVCHRLTKRRGLVSVISLLIDHWMSVENIGSLVTWWQCKNIKLYLRLRNKFYSKKNIPFHNQITSHFWLKSPTSPNARVKVFKSKCTCAFGLNNGSSV